MSEASFERHSLDTVIRRYSRVARLYRYLEWTILLAPGFRGRAVKRLQLEPGQRVLEMGCGTGRNLSLLREAVGADGEVIGVDATLACLAEAEKLIAHRGWSNVSLIHADAAQLTLDRPVDVGVFLAQLLRDPGP